MAEPVLTVTQNSRAKAQVFRSPDGNISIVVPGGATGEFSNVSGTATCPGCADLLELLREAKAEAQALRIELGR
jgi:hypothetical protein